MGELLVSGLPNDVLWAIIVIMGIIMLMLVAKLFYTRVQLRGRQERYWWVLGASDMYMFEYDLANDELLLSEHFSSLLGISSRHIFQFSQVMMHTKNKIFKRGLEHVAHILNNTQNETVESRFELTRGDGSIGIFRVCCNSFYDDQGCLTSKVGILRDITREVHVEEALRARAERDSLTGVYNAGMIRKLIEHDFEEQTRDRTGAFVMLDIDHFKRINDTLGHQAGDKVLQELSRSLHASIRDSDLIGRLGGDEFCIYLPAIPGYDYLCDFCERLNRVASEYLAEIGLGMKVTISVGGVMIHDHETFAEVYDRADELLYGAKNQGRNTNRVIA